MLEVTSVDIAIVIATRNAELHLERCLESILAQRLSPRKVIVQDAVSDDNTLMILRAYEVKFGGILDWKSELDSGIADAWNKALLRNDASWILFLGADDEMAGPDVLAWAADALKKTKPDMRIAYADVVMTDHNGACLERIGMKWQLCRKNFRLSRYCLQHQAVFHRKSFFEEFGFFDLRFRICADQELLLRGLINAEAIYIHGLDVAKMAIGGLSTQRKNIVLINKELLRIQAMHRRVPLWDALHWKLIKACVIQLFYAVGGEGLALKAINFYRVRIRFKSALHY